MDERRDPLREAASRMTLLAEVTSDLALSLDVEGSLRRLARLVVPALADWVIIDLADDGGRPIQVAMLHRDGMEDVIRRFSELQPATMTAEAPIMRILAGAAPILVSRAATKNAGAYVNDAELLDLCDELGICSAMYVPLSARDRVLGSIAFVSGRSGRTYGDDELDFAVELARRAALVVDNTRLYEREHGIAMVLQESLLPTLPEIAGIECVARYLPASRGADVGGDFYDVMALPHGFTAFAVGDVIGHDIAAAATMGQLRALLRGCAWNLAATGVDEPGTVVRNLDQLVCAFELTAMATVFYGQVRAGPGAEPPWFLRYANAGHPPPLLRLPDGSVVTLDAARDVVLGVRYDVERPEAALEIPAGSTLVAFTDGLIERRGERLEAGEERLRSALAGADSDRTLGSLVGLLVDACRPDRLIDDLAILALRFG